ncbi:MAG: ribosome recycling factor [Bacteroidetes bacterium GWC2_33_15]|nr:MAG: ribosome recycling factor [Bacteroidetes bacterium GWA2_33_15]OFX48926.1 MAG: ribosome recycling factor [Bacteroidetes bacterium GWC2_33_15]OFX64810.1 MAG: ribosome recycling factor [Bacteroidetes bacterium GWB2_32_14]OFX68512.1 MAG: ribosome recycling factor [Bacteroidetes bacterium GWD2_33_33]HAN19242.1 ribosome recycling factor [Bacteroidales bacterium]
MTEEVQFIIDETKERMDGAIAHLENELAVLRAGKANPRMLDSIHVDYYGSSTPLTQVANIGTPDAKTIAIQPWEKNLIDTIEKAILAANIGLTPVNNGEIIRLNVPALTEERRKALVKQVHNEGESARVSLRTARRDANEEIKKLSKDGLPEDDAKKAEEVIQKMTDTFSEKIDKVVKIKEEDIMKV